MLIILNTGNREPMNTHRPKNNSNKEISSPRNNPLAFCEYYFKIHSLKMYKKNNLPYGPQTCHGEGLT